MTTTTPVKLRFSQVSKSYFSKKKETVIIDNLNLDLYEGEFVSILGPSGSGKSTILSMAAGLSFPTQGSISLGGKIIDSPGPDRGVVFQQHVLLPWMTALENVLFALESAKPQLSSQERKQIAEDVLREVKLDHAMHRRPSQLSGGMQQRVGIARAFAINPQVFLLDEPFGALDALTRLSLQNLLLDMWEADRRTVLMVTHDVDEALLLSDRIIMLGGSPSHILHDISVPFERPRRIEALGAEPEFIRIKNLLLESLIH